MLTLALHRAASRRPAAPNSSALAILAEGLAIHSRWERLGSARLAKLAGRVRGTPRLARQARPLSKVGALTEFWGARTAWGASITIELRPNAQPRLSPKLRQAALEMPAEGPVLLSLRGSRVLLLCSTSERKHLAALPKFVEIVSPRLHHLHALRPVFGGMNMARPHIVGFLMRKLTLDGVGVPAPNFVEPGRCHCAETVCRHLLRAITEPT